MWPKLVISGAFCYSLCLPNLYPHPIWMTLLSGEIAQILIPTVFKPLVIFPHFLADLNYWSKHYKGELLNHELLGLLKLSSFFPLCYIRAFSPWKSGQVSSGNAIIPSPSVVSTGVNTNWSECNLNLQFNKIIMVEVLFFFLSTKI